MVSRLLQLSTAAALALLSLASFASSPALTDVSPMQRGEMLVTALRPLLTSKSFPEMQTVHTAFAIKFTTSEVTNFGTLRNVNGDATVESIAAHARVRTSAKDTPALVRNAVEMSHLTCISPEPLKNALKEFRSHERRHGTDGFVQPSSEFDFARETTTYLWNISMRESGSCVESLDIYFTKKNK